MSSKADLLHDLRRQREEREEQRRRSAEECAGAKLREGAALRIQRVFRGTAAVRRWSEAEWRCLQKRVRDLDHLAEAVLQKGQRFVAPCKVLLPLMCSASRQRRRTPDEMAELCGRLAALVVGALRAPLADTQRGLCAVLEAPAAKPLHTPDPSHQVLHFAETLLRVVIAARGAAGACELADLLDAQAWGQGRALEESAASRRLVGELLASALKTRVGEGTALSAWRPAAVEAISAWPGGSVVASPRLQGLVDIARAWLRLADSEATASELLEAVISIPRVAPLLVNSQVRNGGAHLPWSLILRSFAKRLKRFMAESKRERKLDREYMLVYASGNLWEVHAAVGLPLEPLLSVQAMLTENLEISMLPGAPADSMDETAALRSLRQQLRHLADPAAVSSFFSHVLCLHQGQSGQTGCRRQLKPYQQHCLAVALQQVSPSMVEALCCIYSTLLVKARTIARTAKAGWGPQVFHGLANMIAYMGGGALAKVLWRFALAFYSWHSGPCCSQPQGCYHILHIHAAALSQLLSVMSHDELHGVTSPFGEQELAEYISLATQLTARLIYDSCDGVSTSKGSSGGGGNAADPPRGLFLEAFLEQVGCTLSQLHTFVGRQPEGCEPPPPQTWHAPADILQDFRRCTEHMLQGGSQQGSSQQAQGLGPASLADRILRHLPHSVPFEQRVALLRAWIQQVRAGLRGRPPTRIIVRRTHIFEDGLTALRDVDWHTRFQVVFVNAAGLQEQGQDVGGLFKEFWEKLAETAFNPDYGLFRATEKRLLFPNPDAKRYHEQSDRLFHFLGLVIGKAIYEGIVVEPCFSPFFLAKLLGRHNSYYDLQSLDPSLFANLQRLKAYDGNVAELCCSFVASSTDGQEVPLLPDGHCMPVTNENRFRYVYLLSDYKLNTELKAGSDAFRAGFQRLVDERWLRIFDEDELHQVISGCQGCSVDLEDLQRHMQFSNCSGPRDKLALDFFAALKAMSPEHHVQMLRFVTSCSRTPLLGFGHLVPPFTVHKVPIRSDSERLPTASTCFNTLKLPTYSNWRVMKQKLELVIKQGAGFELD